MSSGESLELIGRPANLRRELQQLEWSDNYPQHLSRILHPIEKSWQSIEIPTSFWEVARMCRQVSYALCSWRIFGVCCTHVLKWIERSVVHNNDANEQGLMYNKAHTFTFFILVYTPPSFYFSLGSLDAKLDMNEQLWELRTITYNRYWLASIARGAATLFHHTPL